jgi:uncharacterized protein (DUF1778 family)
MNDKRTSRVVLHVKREDMVTLVQAARASRVSIHDFVLQAASIALSACWQNRATVVAACGAWRLPTGGLDEEGELRATVDAIKAYEVKRWPLEAGGRGSPTRGLLTRLGLLLANAFVIFHVALDVVLLWQLARWIAFG